MFTCRFQASRLYRSLSCLCLVPLALCLSFSGIPLYAQLSTTATISGTVTDSTGALVPDATVTIEDQGTHTTTVRQSNQDGSYIAPGLTVGTYSVTITKPGFQTYSVTGIILHPATTASVNGILNVGTASSSVTVSSSVAQVETSTPENATSVDAAQVSTLPINGRNYQGLATLMPGVQNTSSGTALTTGGRSTNNALSVNGLQQNKTFYALDGIWNENTGNMNQTTVVPNPDSLEEVRVLQNNYSARYSLMGSSVVLLQTKSGTSNFHGTAWEFFRNDALNAKPYFAPSIFPYKQNIFGFNLGGPVTIPHLYNTGRQKTFFFFSQQWVILHQVPTNLTGITPTANQRAGIFNSPIKNPATGQLFPQNSAGQYVIPQALINTNSTAFLNALYPLPNFSNGTATNYVNSKPQITNQRDDEIKIDHNFNSKFHLLAEYLDEYQKFAQNSLNGSQAGEVFSTNSETDYTHNKLAQVSLTQILTPNMVNTTNVSMNIFDLDLNLVGTAFVNQVPGFQPNLPYNGFLSNRLPLVTFSGGIAPQGIAAARPLTHAADLDNTIGDDWSWLHGRHFFQAGLSVVFNTKRQNPASATNGQFTFTGTATAPSSGANTLDDALADFLLGRANTFSQASDQIRVPIHAMEVSPYFEDRVKLTKNLTVTAGLRVSYMPLPYAPPSSSTIFSPSAYSLSNAPIVNADATITATPNYNPLNGLVRNNTPGVPQNFSSKHNWYFGPIVGVAWDVFGDGKTSFRGGYGITYTRIFTGQDCSFNCAVNPPRLQSITLQNPSFPNPAGTGTVRPATIAALSNADLNIQATQIHTYSAGIQHEFSRNWIVAITGASSQARHLVGTWNYNQPLHTGSFDFDPTINIGNVTPYAYSTTSGSSRQFSPYPGYAAISTLASRQNQNWNALETSVRHPVTNNLFLTLAYTYSHDLTDFTSGTFNVIDPYNPSRYYGNAEGLNFPHSLSITGIYNLPWLRQAKGLEGLLLGGWKFSDITTIRSGTSLSPGLSISRQGNAIRPDRVPGTRITGPKTRTQWFNTAAFRAPLAGFYGNAGTGSIQGPGLITFDMALYKDFHITEASFFEFRSEAFNVFNHTNFTTIQTNLGSSSYGNATASTDPRILEFALRFHF